MKRHHIRQLLAKTVNVTDAQLRRAIANLNLPVDDNHDYSEEAAQRIIAHISKPSIQQSAGESSTSKSAPSQLFQSQTQAQQAADQAKVALVSANQQRLVGLTTALDKAEQRRGEVLDRLSDRIAYLQDDNLFMNDLLRLAQTKLKQAQQQQPEKTKVTVTALDALVEAFDAVGDWEIPALSPHPCAGALPM